MGRFNDSLGARPVAALALLAACAGDPRPPADSARSQASPPSAAARAPADTLRTLLFLGTSLTAGLGLEPDEAYPALIQRKITATRLPYRVVNAGVSGETSAGLLRRLDWLLQQRLDVVVIETGANDGLRGVPVESVESNLQQIITRIRETHPKATIVLAQMEALPNMGQLYTTRFRAVFPRLARANRGVVLMPFLLDGVAGVAELNQGDGIHPNEEGARRVAENVWKALKPLLD